MLFIISVAAGIVVYYLLKYTIGERNESFNYSQKNKYILWFSLAVGIAIYFGPIWYGTKIPDSIFERSEYETMLYVRLYPNNQVTKSYKVPAKIYKYVHESCYDEDDCASYAVYKILYAIMPNGGSIAFDDFDDGLVLNEVTRVYDEDDREWGVELTNEPVR